MSPKHTRDLLVTVLAILLVGALIALLGGCKKDSSQAPSNDAPKAEEPAVPISNEATKADPIPSAPDGDSAPVADDGSAESPPPANPPEDLTVSLFWVSAGENSLGIQRTIPYTQAVATSAVRELLAGPTDAEKTTWPAIGTAIPEGTKLLGLTVDNGIARVNLSGEFDDGGGTFSMTARLGQIVYTLAQFPTVDAVEFSIEGEKVKVFSSEGIILGRPQTPEDFYDLLPIDA